MSLHPGPFVCNARKWHTLNYNRSGTISPGGGIEADFVFTLQVDPVLLKNFVKKNIIFVSVKFFI